VYFVRDRVDDRLCVPWAFEACCPLRSVCFVRFLEAGCLTGPSLPWLQGWKPEIVVFVPLHWWQPDKLRLVASCRGHIKKAGHNMNEYNLVLIPHVFIVDTSQKKHRMNSIRHMLQWWTRMERAVDGGLEQQFDASTGNMVHCLSAVRREVIDKILHEHGSFKKHRFLAQIMEPWCWHSWWVLHAVWTVRNQESGTGCKKNMQAQKRAEGRYCTQLETSSDFTGT